MAPLGRAGASLERAVDAVLPAAARGQRRPKFLMRPVKPTRRAYRINRESGK